MRTKISIIIEDDEETCDEIQQYIEDLTQTPVQRYEVNEYGSPMSVELDVDEPRYPFPVGD